jgi:hypothetical protein
MSKLQFSIQQLVLEAGSDADGVHELVEANELLTRGQGIALAQLEREEKHRAEALTFAEGLRPYARIEER